MVAFRNGSLHLRVKIFYVFLLLAIGLQSICSAQSYEVDSVGNWSSVDLEDHELAGALHAAQNGDTIQFENDLDLDNGANWENDGHSQIRTQTPNLSLVFDLNNHKLSGSRIGFSTGTGIFQINAGSLEASNAIAIGYGNYQANVQFNGTSITAPEITIGSSTAGGQLTMNNGTLNAATLLQISGYNSELNFNIGATGNIGQLTISQGGEMLLNGTGNISGTALTVQGVGFLETSPGSGIFNYTQSGLSGTGTLNFTGNNLKFENGANVDLSNLFPSNSGYTSASGKSLVVEGIFDHSAGGKSFQTTAKINGPLLADAGTIQILNGGKLSGVTSIMAQNGGTIAVQGAVDSPDSGKKYRAEIVANGTLTAGTTAGSGTVTIKDGGKIGGVTNITVGSINAGTLEINGTDTATGYSAEIVASSSLVVGETAQGTLAMLNGGKITGVTNVTLGKEGNANVSLDGIWSGNARTSLTGSGDLVIGQKANTTLSITKGAILKADGTAVLAENAVSTVTLNISGLGGSAGTTEATLQTGNITVAESGKVTITVGNGGSLRTGSVIMAQEAGSVANVTINTTSGHTSHRGWAVGGPAVDPGFAKGNANLTVNSGIMDISGFFSMGAQDEINYGKAIFDGSGAELRMSGGTFRNEGLDDDTDLGNGIGDTSILNGAVVSGSGNILSGNQFLVDEATISPGSRWMYDFNRGNNDKLTSLGILEITDNDLVDTVFRNTTFQTQLDRGSSFNPLDSSNPDALSDRVLVNGDLAIDGFNINISRVLDGDYLLVKTNGGIVSGYTAKDLSLLGADAVDINLNGKTLKGNNRVDFSGGITTTLDDYASLLDGYSEINLHINSLTDGNVTMYWTGESSTTWDMVAENFDATATINTRQFLDGDIVIFDDDWMDSYGLTGGRVIDVTTDAKYGGNVVVAEVQVLGGGSGETIFTWNGGKIIAYDSALYTTLDQGAGKATPSGKLTKIGAGTLVINNANEFYGGVFLGENGVGGGVINVNHNDAFGNYNSTSGFLNRGVVFVMEDSTLEIGNNISLQNRFVVADGKKLNINFQGDFTISGNDATADTGANGINGGKGGGIYIGDGGQIIYGGTDTMKVTKNLAVQGGGIYTMQGYTLAVPTSITGNIATQSGGGIYAEKQFELRDSSDLKGNATFGTGGGVYVGYGSSASLDEVFTIHGASSVTDNLAGGMHGGGIYVDGGRIVELKTQHEGTGSSAFKGGDIWFEGNYTGAVFDKDHPTNMSLVDTANAQKNAIHLSYNAGITQGAVLDIEGPYNVYFYDPITGDAGTHVNIKGTLADGSNTELAHASLVANGQRGTVIFREDSQFYGNTTVEDGATFRLEKGASTVEAVYGRKGSLETNNPIANTFEIKDGSALSGSGTIIADNIMLNGNVDLDTGTLSRPTGRDGSGSLSMPEMQSQGIMNLEGAVTVTDTADWKLNLTNADGNSPKSDLINVTGTTAFSGLTSGQKLTLNLDSLVRGRYAILTSTGGITGFNTVANQSDAQIFFNTYSGIDFSQSSLPDDTLGQLGRVKVNTYVDPQTQKTLYLDVTSRNRHVTASSGGLWGYDKNWTFSGLNPTGFSGGLTWAEFDTGPVTSVYLDGDMVTLTGGNYTLSSDVRPVDLFVNSTGDVGILGTFGITTYSLSSMDALTTSILGKGTGGINDYGIDLYTGKLYKRDLGTLTFSNTGTNLFSEGIEIGSGGVKGGVIAFNNGNQLTVGQGRFLDFVDSGTLRATSSATLATNTRISVGKTGTFEVLSGQTLTMDGFISDAGTLGKTGAGTLLLNHQNTFIGGTIFSQGLIQLGYTDTIPVINQNLGIYSTPGGTAGQVSVTGAGNKTLVVGDNQTIRNRFVVDGSHVTNQLTFDVAANFNLTIDSVNAGNAIDGGAVSVDAAAKQLTVTGSGSLTFNNNQARNGGAIFTKSSEELSIINNLKMTGNMALAGDGGAIYAKNVTITNNDSTVTTNFSGNSATDQGGVFYIDDAGLLTLNAAAGNILFKDNTANEGGAVYLADDADVTLTVADKMNIIFDDTLVSSSDINHVFTKNGAGLVAFTGSGNNNIFYGTTDIKAGTMRVVQGVSFGSSGVGTKFNLDLGTVLSGGGTLRAEIFDIKGTIDIDKSTSATTVADADKIGTMTLVGNVTLTGNATAPLLRVDMKQTTANPTIFTLGDADLLDVDGTLTVAAGSKVLIDIHNYSTGMYKIIETNGLTVDASFTNGVNGIGANGAFNIFVHGEEATDRHKMAFHRGDDDISDGITTQTIGGSANDLWLVTEYNNLHMYWTGAEDKLWQTTNTETHGNWWDNATSGETHVENADSVVFQDDSVGGVPKNKDISLGSDVVVTNMLVDTSGTYSFAGNYKITTSGTYAGSKLTSALQKLEKKGTGTLSFTNTGDNNFAGGIWLEGGITTFTLASQLGTMDGTTDNGINFVNNAILQANANSNKTLTNKIVIGSSATATINTNTAAANSLTLTGVISGNALTKTGTGLLILDNTLNSYIGTTTVSGGTLQANGVGTLGTNVAAHEIQLATGTTLNLNITGTETLHQLIKNVGSNTTGIVTKSGGGTLTLDNTNTYSGQTNITGGTLIAETIGAINGSNTATVNLSSSTATLEMKLDSSTENGVFTKQLTGSGNLAKSGTNSILTLNNTTNNFTGSITVQDGTDGNLSKIIAKNASSLGGTTGTLGTITLTGKYDHLEVEQSSTTNNTLAKKISGLGQLIKTGNENLVLTGTNDFTGGTELNAGQVTIGHNTALGTYAYSAASPLGGQINMNINGTTVTTDTTARIVQNRFHIAPDLAGTGATITANANLTIQNVDSSAASANGGAVYVGNNSNLTLNANGGDITFANNKDKNGANDIYLDNADTLTLTGSKNMFFGGGIDGSGTITKTGTGIVQLSEDSNFIGATSVQSGTLRITSDKTLGSSTAGTAFALSTGATLAGQGTILADSITINGIIDADQSVFSSGNTAVATDKKFGIITLDGDSLLSGFTFEYDANAPYSANPMGDLLVSKNGAMTIDSGTIDLRTAASGTTGKFLVIDADRNIDVTSGTGNDELNASLGLTINGQAITNYSPRASYNFEYGNANLKGLQSQIWLDVTRNTLDMDWTATAAGDWGATSTNQAWTSQQGVVPGKAKTFNDGDYVHFTQATGAGTITITNNVIVSGMEVNSTGNYTFDGSGGIQGKTTHASMEGEYLKANGGTIIPDGKLTKSGTGTLTFTNTGGNTFDGGIEISGGAIAFTLANQLGDNGKGITFLGNGTLQSSADGLTLANNLILANTKTATVNTNGNTLTLSGKIDEQNSNDVGNFTKSGAGTLILTNAANAWAGTTSVIGGILQADGVATLGSGTSVAVSSGATLQINNVNDETLSKVVSGAGNLSKTGAGTLTINAANTYTGATTISAGKVIAETVGAINGTSTASLVIESGTTLEMKLDGSSESGVLGKLISGSGTLTKSGNNSVLTLNNVSNTFIGAITVQGGTSGNVSKLTANNASTLGMGTTAITLTGVDDHLEINQTATGTLARTIVGSGRFIKSGTGELTLSSNNTFTGGTEFKAGTLVLNHVNALNQTTNTGTKQGVIDVTGTSSVKTANGIASLKNRFEVSGTGTQLTLAVPAISDNDITGSNGGGIELKDNASFNTSQALAMSGNKTNQSGGAVYAPNAHIVVQEGGFGVNTISTLTNNQATLDGGGVYAKSVAVNAATGGTTISGNTAGRNGGVFYLVGGSSGNNEVSTFNATNGTLTFDGNTANSVANAVHLNEYATLVLTGTQNIHFKDGITSTNTGTLGNLVQIDFAAGPSDSKVASFYGTSNYYGDTKLESGAMKLESTAHYGATSADNIFRQMSDSVLFGTGTVEAQSIQLGGKINAGNYTSSVRTIDIATLNLVGDVTIGDLVGLGQTTLVVDINPHAGQTADLLNIDGTLTILGTTITDFNIGAPGKYQLIHASGGITGYTINSSTPTTPEGETIVTDFVPYIMGSLASANRFDVFYTVENNDYDLFANIAIKDGYIYWNGAGDTTHPNNTSNDPDDKNKWINDPYYNWTDQSMATSLRFLQGDRVAFNSVADVAARLDYLDIRKNIEIITHENDVYFLPDDPGNPAKATVTDMLVTGGGTYRFTGKGIDVRYDRNTIDPANYDGQLFIQDDSGVVFANEANNFERGIILEDGNIAISNADQMGTIFVNDFENSGITSNRGITIVGADTYGRIYANDDMTLETPVYIEQANSNLIVNTDGNHFGDASVTGDYTVTWQHSSINPIQGQANGISGLGGLVKEGSGTLVLADANYYQGGTTIEGGVISISADNQLGKSTSGITLNGGILLVTASMTQNRPITLGSGHGTIETNSGVTLTEQGVVSGVGNLTKTGTGKLILTNSANSYEGTTIITNGSLQAESVAALGVNDVSKDVHIGTGTMLQMNTSLVEEFKKTLTGSGNFLKTGTGSLALGNQSSFTGQMSVTGGELGIMGHVDGIDSLIVGSGGTLFGIGRITSSNGTLIQSGGTLRPRGVVANDPDATPTTFTPLTFDDDLTFASGSRYHVVITQYGDPTYDLQNPNRMRPISDSIVVDGDLSIESNVNLVVDIDYWGNNLGINDFSEDSSGRFTIIEANGAYNSSETFANVDISLPRGVEVLHGWDSSLNLYQLWFQGNPMSSLGSLGGISYNRHEVGQALDHLTLAKDIGMKDLINILSQKGITDAMIPDILSQLSGDLRANAMRAVFKTPWRHPFQHIDRDRFVSNTFVKPGHARLDRLEVWGEFYDRYGNFGYDGNAYGYRVNRPGVVVGADKPLSSLVLLGASFNASNAQLTQQTGKADFTDFELGTYGFLKLTEHADMKFYAGYGYQMYSLDRYVQIPDGGKYPSLLEKFHNHAKGHSLSASIELSRPFHRKYGTTTPILAFDYEHAWQDGYRENSGKTALNYDPMDYGQVMLRLGVKRDIRRWEKLNLQTRYQYSTRLNGTRFLESNTQFAQATTPHAMNIRALDQGRDFMNFGIRGQYYFNKTRTMHTYFGYDADLYRHGTAHTGTAGFVRQW